MRRSPKILFLVPYPLHRAPSQRFRVELFLPFLKSRHIHYCIEPFLDETTFSVLYQPSSAIAKAWGVFKGFLKRCWIVLFKIHSYDFIFIHREAAPIGPPVFEFLIAKLFRKKIIYDFDDAIWIPDSTNQWLNRLKSYWKIKWLCKWSYKVAGGNDYLCDFARQYNDRVFLLPTCVDVINRHNRLKDQDERPVTIGWTGSHSTLKYLDRLVPVLTSMAAETGVRIRIICNQPPVFHLPQLEFVKWQESTEIEDLLGIHIGIMPLEEDAWSEGKCGFKLIQYLALGIPAVASPVGVNKKIVEEGQNGYLCQNESEWKQAILTLVHNPQLRKEMGARGRQTIIKNYSIQAYEGLFLNLFE